MTYRLSAAVLGVAATFAIAAPANAAPPEVAHGSVVSDSELDGLRGGDGNTVIITSQTLSAIASGNTINGGFAAGNVNISDQALSNFNGFGNVIINTGAQVTLQTGMNVTINMSQ